MLAFLRMLLLCTGSLVFTFFISLVPESWCFISIGVNASINLDASLKGYRLQLLATRPPFVSLHTITLTLKCQENWTRNMWLVIGVEEPKERTEISLHCSDFKFILNHYTCSVMETALKPTWAGLNSGLAAFRACSLPVMQQLAIAKSARLSRQLSIPDVPCSTSLCLFAYNHWCFLPLIPAVQTKVPLWMLPTLQLQETYYTENKIQRFMCLSNCNLPSLSAWRPSILNDVSNAL